MKKYFIFFFVVSTAILSAQTAMVVSVKTYEPDCELGAAKITATGGVPPYTYQWNNGALGDSVSSLNGGNYSVHVTDSDTSEADVSFDVAAYVCKVSLSNKFSPNGDGINDFWSVGRVENYPDFFLQVFDRWGQVVHQQRHQFIPWDGTHLGLKLPDATYYVVFYYEEGKTNNIEKGSVTLVR